MSEPEGLVAPCARCGAPQPITLLPQVRPCSYCRAPDPLPPAVRSRVADVARLVAAADDRRVSAEVAERAGDLGWMAIALVGGSLLVGGGLALAWVANDLPGGTGVVSFLLHGRAPKLDRADVTAFWWLLFSLVLLIAACFPWVWGGQLAVYVTLGRLRALPPLQPGGAARCHLCGDDLPPQGVVRSCKSCKADNLVDGARFRAAATTFAAAIEAAEKAVHQRVGTRIARIESGILWAAGAPFILLLVMPISLAVDGPHPELLWLPPALIGLGVVLRILGAITRPAR